MIHIEQPQISEHNGFACLETYISIDGHRDKIWFKVEKQFGQYLCHERSDAYVIAVLHYAIVNGHDITCDAPLSEYLYYNIVKYLIPAIISYNPQYRTPNINAPIAYDQLPNAGAVGTGISCGVDSLHALACQTHLEFKNHNITHLTFNNVGSHGEGEMAREFYKKRLDRPRRFAEEYGFTFVESDSNLMDVVKQSHFHTHTFSSMFAVYCLQKLFSIYYYASSGHRYHELSLELIDSQGAGSYEVVSLPLFSTPSLRIYSEGENLTRMQKLKSVIEYAPSYKYLNVCLNDGDNCGRCEKCVRTLLGLDAAGALDHYTPVFNIEYYKQYKSWYLKRLLVNQAFGKHDYIELYKYMKKDITIYIRMAAFLSIAKEHIRQMGKKVLQSTGLIKYYKRNGGKEHIS